MRRAALLCPLVALLASCAEAVDLGTVELRPWQPETLAAGDGDLLDDAQRVDVTLVVDGEEQTFSLGSERVSADQRAAAEGSEVSARLRTVGRALPDAIGRSGPARLAPGAEGAVLPLMVAPPGVEHRLSSSLPDGAAAPACISTTGTLWLGSLEVDPVERALTGGPALAAERAGASCAVDDEGGRYLLGGCSGEGAPTGGLWYDDDEVDPLPGAGCGTALARHADGRLVGIVGESLFVYDPPSGALSTLPLAPPRYFAELAVFPGAPLRVLVSGGFADVEAGVARDDSALLEIAADGASVTSTATLMRAFDALAVATSGGVLALDDDEVVSVGADLSVAPSASLPFEASALVAIDTARYAALSLDGAALALVSPEASHAVAISPPRPGGRLFGDPGGALLVVGGGVAGISLVIAE